MKYLLLSLLILLVNPAFAAGGLITLNSGFDVPTTVDRLEDVVKNADFKVIARVKHSAAAKSVDLDLRPTQLLIFGKPKAGSLLMQEAQSIGIDLPMKYLVWQEAEQMARLPLSQLAAMKLIVNQAYENMGLHGTQTLGPILDGYMRNTPDALRFIEIAGSQGVGAAIAERDGPFDDYSQAPASEQPSRDHVIVAGDRNSKT